MSRPNPSRLGIYIDVREAADLALSHGGGEYTCTDTKTAQNFAHRFYRFRNLYRDIHHSDGSICKYDQLVLPRVTTDTVVFTLRKAVGVFKPAGSPAIPTSDDDDLFNIATQLAAKLKGK